MYICNFSLTILYLKNRYLSDNPPNIFKEIFYQLHQHALHKQFVIKECEPAKALSPWKQVLEKEVPSLCCSEFETWSWLSVSIFSQVCQAIPKSLLPLHLYKFVRGTRNYSVSEKKQKKSMCRLHYSCVGVRTIRFKMVQRRNLNVDQLFCWLQLMHCAEDINTLSKVVTIN